MGNKEKLKAIKEFIIEEREKSQKQSKEINKIAPNSYGLGVEYGIVSILNDLEEFINYLK